MSHVERTTYAHASEQLPEEQMRKAMQQPKWQTVHVAISQQDLKDHFKFLNDAVVLRSGREGVPLLTTTGIFGPIRPGTRVRLTPGEGTGVEVVSEEHSGKTLIAELTELRDATPAPDPKHAATVYGKWVSVKDGGAIPGLGGSANVFGGTGSLFINQQAVNLPVLQPHHEAYTRTLAYYGARLLKPRESFYMGFDKLLFGMEYDTVLPDYISGYAMQPFGGGGLFVEHHPFPHIWLPRPDKEGTRYCTSKITLGKKISGPNAQERPSFHFTTFRVPADGSALAVDENTIHNDSYTNGPQTVFLANTAADTVALRETAPYQNILLQEVAD